MATGTKGKTARAVRKELLELGRIAAALVDGDEAGRILAERSLQYIKNPNPKFRFMTGDYLDVDHGAFLRTKKLLLRIQRLADFRTGTALWMRYGDLAGKVVMALQNGSLNRYYGFGDMTADIRPEMAECIEKGEVVLVPDEERRPLTVLAPVRDSLQDVVGLVEISAPNPGSGKLLPAWS